MSRSLKDERSRLQAELRVKQEGFVKKERVYRAKLTASFFLFRFVVLRSSFLVSYFSYFLLQLILRWLPCLCAALRWGFMVCAQEQEEELDGIRTNRVSWMNEDKSIGDLRKCVK